MVLFKIGDRVKPKKRLNGYISILDRYLDTDDILTISSIDDDRGNGIIYGFEEDVSDRGRPHWLNVERNFELADINWRKRLKVRK